MKQEIIKYKSSLFNQEVTLIIDEELNKLKGKVLFPKSLEEANKALDRLKTTMPKDQYEAFFGKD